MAIVRMGVEQPPHRPAGFVILGRARQQVEIERRSKAAGPVGLKPELPGYGRRLLCHTLMLNLCDG
jgi:hypothetical protein